MTYARFWRGAARARADSPARMIAEERMVILGKYRWYALCVDVCLIPDQRLLKLLVFESVKIVVLVAMGANCFVCLVIATERAVEFRSTCDSV